VLVRRRVAGIRAPARWRSLPGSGRVKYEYRFVEYEYHFVEHEYHFVEYEDDRIIEKRDVLDSRPGQASQEGQQKDDP
jgi:hypothetical protein